MSNLKPNNRTRLVPTWRMVWIAFAAGMVLSAWASYGGAA